MNQEARELLCDLVRTRGRNIIENPEWLEGQLLASLSVYPRELNILLAALHEDIPVAIYRALQPLPEGTLERLSSRLEDCQMLKPDAAHWAVTSWAQAIFQANPAGQAQMPVTGGQVSPARTRQLRSRMAIEVQARPTGQPQEHFRVWGNTPGTVPLPDEYEYIFKKTALNDSNLQKLSTELAQVGVIYGLELSSGRYSAEALVEMLTQPYLYDLRSLWLSGTATTTDAVMTALARLVPNLKELNPGSKCYVTDDGVAALRDLLRLKRLSLSSCQKITNRGMASLRGVDTLEELSLSHVLGIGDDGLAHLKTMPALRVLDLSGCFRITEMGLSLLGDFPALADLRLNWNNRITDAGLQGLRPLDDLQRLSLVKCINISDAGISALVDLRDLEELDLAWLDRLTDASLDAVSQLRKLRGLSLYQCSGLTDAGISRLSALRELRRLDLAGVDRLTDSGLNALKYLDHLEELTLDGKHISGAALIDLAQALPDLRRLHVWSGSQVSQEEAAQIRRPGMDVWIRGAR